MTARPGGQVETPAGLEPRQISLGKLNDKGTAEMHTLVIGQALTGLSAFS